MPARVQGAPPGTASARSLHRAVLPGRGNGPGCRRPASRRVSAGGLPALPPRGDGDPSGRLGQGRRHRPRAARRADRRGRQENAPREARRSPGRVDDLRGQPSLARHARCPPGLVPIRIRRTADDSCNGHSARPDPNVGHRCHPRGLRPQPPSDRRSRAGGFGALCQETSPSTAWRPVSTMGAPVHPDGPPSRTDAAVPPDELRPVTALFADIVGSTSLGERLTPAEVKALIGECVSRMSRAVEEFGGIIQAYTGDGICAYFGVPVAHEDDPERAARAALRIINMAREYARDVEAAWGLADFNVRVGINTGPAGVGLVGGETPQALALGDATNVAARLESAAEPGTIAVGSSTARRLAMSFILESLGQIMVKG